MASLPSPVVSLKDKNSALQRAKCPPPETQITDTQLTARRWSALRLTPDNKFLCQGRNDISWLPLPAI
eukprot:7635093-Prorocentrum_lima.AAC.1